MVISPKIRNNVCLNCHPQGCKELVDQQISYMKNQHNLPASSFKKVVVIGGSAGYGLAGRIALAFGWDADTLNISFEKESSGKRPATVGLYNTKAFEQQAKAKGLYAESLYGDAYSEEMKQQAAEKIASDLGKVDLVLYSIASPVRPKEDGGLYKSVLKPLGQTYTSQSINLDSRTLDTVSIEPANEDEAAETIKVMGGEDWQRWISVLQEKGVLADGCMTLALSYIGPEITQAVYREGTIGGAKKHLEATAGKITKQLASENGRAFVSVNKAVVTRASAVIPVVPLYIGVLMKVMRQKGLEENCVEQMCRLFAEKLANDPQIDAEGRIRLDDYEMREDVQKEVMDIWKRLTNENLEKEADIDTYEQEFLHIHGFGFDSIDYSQDVPFELGYSDDWVR
jgi:enoyl-[acyl-carrier protein] reductase/trans-2-enoyl-CoA reductase (NAD+)